MTGNPGTCGDYAEYYTASEIVSPADVVSLDPTAPSGKLVQRSRTSYDAKVMGVAATNPAFVIEENQIGIGGGMVSPSAKPPIALAGRVPVKVSTINGPLHIGDVITSSALIGFGMKLTHAGPTVGKVMEEFDPANGNTGEGVFPCPDGTPSGVMCGETYVFVNVSWADPAVQITSSGDLNVASSLPSQTSPATPAVLGDSTATASASLSATMTDPLSQLGSTASLLQTQYASLSAKMTKLDQIDDLSKRITALEKNIPLFSASSSGSLTNGDATISGQLSVTGKTLLADVGITGKVSMGLLTIDGMGADLASPAAEINTLSGPLKFQSLALNGIDFENGKVTIDTDGNMVVNGDLTAKSIKVDELKITRDKDQAATIGNATIPAGQTSVTIKTTAVKANSEIFVTSKTNTTIPLNVTSQVDGTSFTVKIGIPLDEDVNFNYWIIN